MTVSGKVIEPLSASVVCYSKQRNKIVYLCGYGVKLVCVFCIIIIGVFPFAKIYGIISSWYVICINLSYKVKIIIKKDTLMYHLGGVGYICYMDLVYSS